VRLTFREIALTAINLSIPQFQLRLPWIAEMATLLAMVKDSIDNAWVAKGLRATGKENIELAKVLGIHPSGVTRILKNKRALKDFEAKSIKDWFRNLNYNVPQNGHNNDGLLAPTVHTGTSGQQAGKEAPPMSDKTLLKFFEMLVDDVKDLKEQVRALKDEKQAPGSTRKRRTRP
jgi:hypothetical protein